MYSLRSAAVRRWAMLIGTLVSLLLPMPAAAQTASPTRVLVPSTSYRTIQAGIDAVAPNGIVIIRPGVYNEALVISKPIAVTGSGMRGLLRTEIVGPRSTSVGSIEQAHAAVTYRAGGGGSISGVTLRGFDAGVANEPSNLRNPPTVRVRDVIIEATVRGIVGTYAELSVSNVTILHTLWNGMSIVGQHVQIEGTSVLYTQGKGILLTDPTGTASVEISAGAGVCNVSNAVGTGIAVYGVKSLWIHDCFIGNNGGMGSYVNGAKTVLIENSFVSHNHEAGVRLDTVGQDATLNGLIVTDTQPAVSDGRFGDGVNVMTSSQASLINSSIMNSSRAGVGNFGSLINVKDDLFDGNLFHVAGEKWLGKDFNYGDLGGNICGATLPNGFSEVVCQVTSPGLEAPQFLPPDP